MGRRIFFPSPKRMRTWSICVIAVRKKNSQPAVPPPPPLFEVWIPYEIFIPSPKDAQWFYHAHTQCLVLKVMDGLSILLYIITNIAMMSAVRNRPYALTSRLHNNDAMLGVKTIRAASQSVRGPGPARRYMGHAEVGPLAACLAMAHVAVPRLTPNAAGRPFCDVICIRSIDYVQHNGILHLAIVVMN